MNILFGVYPWAFDCPGGGERQLMAWKRHLASLGVRVSLYDQWEPRIRESEVFHFFSVMPGSYQLCDYIKRQGLKLIISPNLWVTQETKYRYPHDEILALLHLADRVLVNSCLEAGALSAVYELPSERFSVAYNGVEDQFLEPVGAEEFYRVFPQLEGRRFLLNVANIEPRKNQLLFLEGLSEYPDIALVNAGHVRDASYAQRCRERGGDRFVELGELPYGSILLRSALSACSGFVMPSTLETPSIAALEAAAFGKPVLVTEIGSAKEYFGPDATYVLPENVESLRVGISVLLSSKVASSKVTERVRRFTWSASAASLKIIYKSLLT